MCYYLKTMKVRSPKSKIRSTNVRRGLRLGLRLGLLDDRGVAALEGILVLAVFAGVFLSCVLLVQWGTYLQSAQMGARLLAFDAGDIELAKLGKLPNHPTQQFAIQSWDTLVNSPGAVWLGSMFTLSDASYSGSVTGTARGRLPGQGASLFELAPAAMGYHSRSWSAASNPWGVPESVAQLAFLRISYKVARYQVNSSDLVSMVVESIPHQVAVLETIYARVGAR